MAELTGLLRRSAGGDRLANWPTDMRIICRRERPSSGAQLSLMEEADGWRYQLVATNTPTGHAQFLEARHRPHARVEDRIRTGKNTGIGHLPSNSFALNQAWCVAATIACDLLCWLRLLCLDGPLAEAEPKTLRYRLLHTAARLVRGQRTQGGGRGRVQEHHAGLAELGVLDHDRLLVQVDVVAAEAAGLSLPHAGHGQQADERPPGHRPERGPRASWPRSSAR